MIESLKIFEWMTAAWYNHNLTPIHISSLLTPWLLNAHTPFQLPSIQNCDIHDRNMHQETDGRRQRHSAQNPKSSYNDIALFSSYRSEHC